ncbi:MAG: CPBP family intramembrane metalloprotease, partial [Alistipes sp.]|nr:CPBP family intramembrane metalloprotease [Alistipes sp.]
AQTGMQLAATYALSMALTLGGVLLYRRKRGGRGPLARFSARGLDPAVLGWAFVLILAAGIVVEPLTARLPGPPYEAMGRGAWTFAALAVLAPLFEELLCRGIVLEAVRARHGAVRAWLVSSLFFGVMHLYPAQAVGAFVVGLVLGYVCIATGSLWGAVALHALNNALAYALMTAGYADATFADAVGSRGAYAALYVAALALAVVSGRMIRAALRRIDRAADKNQQAA